MKAQGGISFWEVRAFWEVEKEPHRNGFYTFNYIEGDGWPVSKRHVGVGFRLGAVGVSIGYVKREV